MAYAVSHWEVIIECPGGEESEETYDQEADTAEQRYNGGAPRCGQRRVWSGCVIARGMGGTRSAALEDAEEAALERARELLEEDRDKECPDNCQGGQMAAPSPDSLVARRLRIERVQQSDRTRYVAYVEAHWAVTLTCPEPVSLQQQKVV